MYVIYIDEYGESIYWGSVSYPAQVGDTIMVDGEEYFVKSRLLIPQEDKIIITVTQNIVRSSVAENSDNGRHTQMHNAIIALSKRQDASEKTEKALREKLISTKKNLTRAIKQDKKD